MVSMLDRLHFTLTLELVTDLHIGGGEREKLSTLIGKPRQNNSDDDPEVALVARGFCGKPILPATAVKGALRRGIADEECASRMFGSVKQSDGTGNAGCVWLETAVWSLSPSDCPDLPHWEAGKRHTFIQSHVALERTTSTASDQKLYCVERVPAGTRFMLSGDILAAPKVAKEHLQGLLAILAAGISLGADERHGAGRAVLVGDATGVHHGLDTATGEACCSESCATISPEMAKTAAVTVETIELTCRGPYVSLDASRETGNVRAAARRSEQWPTLAASSLLGALRTRCAWLSHSLTSLDAAARGDAPFRDAIPRHKIADLTATERLFGVNGWRGLVRVVSLDLKGEAARPYVSVALDRFTQGPLDEALFATEIYVENKLKFALALDRRAGFPSKLDEKLFEKLLKDVRNNGLVLGHGGNKGFGWFEPAKVPRSAPTLDARTSKIIGGVPLAGSNGENHRTKKKR